MTVAILVTGGTFDKEYNMITGELYFKHTHIAEMLEMGRNHVNVRIEMLMLIDSLDMNPEHRQKVLDACKSAEEDRIVITHGTDTMVETAKMLASANLGKTIVLTGAIIPIKFGSSDGLFNLGSSLAFAQSMPPGVYISMHGKIFDWDKVRKNRENGIFEELE